FRVRPLSAGNSPPRATHSLHCRRTRGGPRTAQRLRARDVRGGHAGLPTRGGNRGGPIAVCRRGWGVGAAYTGGGGAGGGGGGGGLAPAGFSVAHAVEIGRQAADAGADALLLMPPIHPYLSDAGFRDYFRAIAAAVSLPLLAYKKGPVPSDNLLVDLA